jgi:hypothetical protein
VQTPVRAGLPERVTWRSVVMVGGLLWSATGCL